MSDPINHDALSDDLFRNRIAAALRELDQPESDADIADALDAVDVEPLGEAATSRIMRQLRRSIAETSASPTDRGQALRTDRGQALRTDRGQALRNSELAVRPIPNSEAPDPGAIGRRLSRMVIVVACAALIAVGLAFHRFDYVERSPLRSGELISLNDRPAAARTSLAERSANSAAIQRVHLGETLSTGPREKRRVTLLDGSVLSINEQSRVTIVAERRVKLLAGEVFVEVLPTANAERFVVETPQRTVTALGTKFVVKAQEQATSVVVTQGTVQVSGVEAVIPAGQELIADQSDSPSVELRPAKRSAYVVEWVKDLLAATGSMVVPVSEHAGGTVTVVDPNGQEMKLSLRKFHVDVYIEEGFARTTIDQTYFNHTWQQLEGTFRFPLPADASLSRLAMYVNGKLMEGGMVERDYGRNVFEQIRHTQRDPALLEWVDGSTFQMRVFPLEARQEKRILLSYTQRLPNDYGRSVYRFPAGHSLEGVREWSAHLRVKGAAGTKWYSPSHLLNGRVEQEDLFLDGREEYAALDRDLVVELTEPQGASRGPNAAQQSPRVLANAANPGEPEGVSPMALTLEAERRKPSGEVSQDSTKPDGLRRSASMKNVRPVPGAAAWSLCEHDGFQYVMLRQSVWGDASSRTLDAERRATLARQWVFLVENSADRNEILAETQRQIVNVLLDNAEHSDTFSLIRAGTQAESFRRKPVECSLENVAAAQQFLTEVAPIGALDLEQALQAVQKQVRGKGEVFIVHLGTGIPVLGERDESTLLRRLPTNARYVGVAVGKRWSKSFMETAAIRSGGHVTQINPDEAVSWRAFDLLSTLNAPRLTEIVVRSTPARSVSSEDVLFLAPKGARLESPGRSPGKRDVFKPISPEGARHNESRPFGAENRATSKCASEGERSNDTAPESSWLLLTTSLAHGQELAAVARFPKGQALPLSVTITGKLNGKPYSQTVIVSGKALAAGQSPENVDRETQSTHASRVRHAGHLPRTWARLEIDRLISLGAAEHKSRIIELSKSMSVMSPFTSLLVLETEAMYEQFQVDRGRKDHWAMYPAPAEIPVVGDQGPMPRNPLDAAMERLKLTQARANSARSNYERSVTEQRPASDLQRLDRMTRAEQAEIRLIEREIQRIERENAAAADPIRLAWDSVVQRRTAWQQSYFQAAQNHWNFWGKPTLSGDRRFLWRDSEGVQLDQLRGDVFPFPGLSELGNVNGPVADHSWLSRPNHTWDVSGDLWLFRPRYLFGHGHHVEWSDLDLPALNRPSDTRPYLPLTSFSVQNLDGLLNINGTGNLSGSSFEALNGRWDANRNGLVDGFTSSPTLYGRHRYVHGNAARFRAMFGDVRDLTATEPNADVDDTAADWIHMQNNSFLAYRGVFGRDHRQPRDWWMEELFDQNEFVGKFIGGSVRNISPSFHRPVLVPMARGGDSLFGRFGKFDVDSDGDGIPEGIWLDVATGGSPAGPQASRLWLRTGLFRDLPSYAPGLQTWPADRLAIVEQATTTKPQHGEVDPEARRLIEKARSLGWEKVRLMFNRHANGVRDRGGLTRADNRARADGVGDGVDDTRARAHADGVGVKRVNGSGHFVIEREVGEGLIEQVIHDGSTMWHLYPEIGLGAKRAVSRFHQSAIQSLIPWYVPSAEDLSVEADVKVVGERTIRIVGFRSAKARPFAERKATVAVELVFAEDGRLSETRVIDLSANKRLAKQTFSAKGTVRRFDAEDKLIGEMNYERQPIEAPNLVPAIKDLVVLPMPYRSAAGVPVSVPVNLQTNAPDFAKLSDDDALLLLATYFAEARSHELVTFIEQRFTAKGDHRIGLAVLLSSVVPQNVLVANATKQHLDVPLAKFLEQFARIVSQGQWNGTLDAGESAGSFLKRVCSAHNYEVRWGTDQAATRERPATEIEQELAATLLFIREGRSVELAAKLLATIHLSLKRTERMNATFARQLNDAAVAIAEQHGVPAFARTARIEWLLTVGDEAAVAQAKELFRLQLVDEVGGDVERAARWSGASGGVTGGPPVLRMLATTRAAFVKHFKTPDGKPCTPWGELVKEAAKMLADSMSGQALAAGHSRENVEAELPVASAMPLTARADEMTPSRSPERFTLIALARACVSLNEPTLAAEIFQRAIQDQDLRTQPRLNLAALFYAKEANNWEQAEACVRLALADEKLHNNSRLWRDAAEIARQLRKFNEWIECLDRAYELEFAALPKTVNLEVFRQDYDRLFGQLEQRAEQLADARHSEKLSFARLVQRAAARWRDIDNDDTVACHRTAAILTKLGLATAAWNYWTTPLAETPDRSAVWQTFAVAMHSQQRLVVADRAWSTAFACEPTNPDILLQHAKFLSSTRQELQARELLTKITTSTWQPRFENTKQQAQALLTELLQQRRAIPRR